MSSAVRDRLARSRVRDYLVQAGPIQDGSGRATALLKDAVQYKGSAVAFIQLITAMDKAAEIKREIRGKRTYRISAVEASSGETKSSGLRTPVAGVEARVAGLGVDYDELARAVLREMWRVMSVNLSSETTVSASVEDVSTLDAVRLERDRLVAERDEYARRLQLARVQLSALISESLPLSAGADLAARLPDLSMVEQAS